MFALRFAGSGRWTYRCRWTASSVFGVYTKLIILSLYYHYSVLIHFLKRLFGTFWSSSKVFLMLTKVEVFHISFLSKSLLKLGNKFKHIVMWDILKHIEPNGLSPIQMQHKLTEEITVYLEWSWDVKFSLGDLEIELSWFAWSIDALPSKWFYLLLYIFL